MGTPAGCEQGNRGWRKDPMGPWTLAAHGGCTFERLSISFFYLCFLLLLPSAPTASASRPGRGNGIAAARLGLTTARLDARAILEWTLARECRRHIRNGKLA